jgi:hypothetical protein
MFFNKEKNRLQQELVNIRLNEEKYRHDLIISTRRISDLTDKNRELSERNTDLLAKNRELYSQRSIFLRLYDQQNTFYAVLAICRADIKEASYIISQGVLQIVLTTVTGQGESKMQWYELTEVVKKDGRLLPQPKGGYKQDMFHSSKLEHNVVNIVDTGEIRKVWDFLNTGLEVEELFQWRAEFLADMEALKKKKELEQQEALKREMSKSDAAIQQQESKDLIQKNPLTVAAVADGPQNDEPLDLFPEQEENFQKLVEDKKLPTDKASYEIGEEESNGL